MYMNNVSESTRAKYEQYITNNVDVAKIKLMKKIWENMDDTTFCKDVENFIRTHDERKDTDFEVLAAT
jgi:hypothetical protein